MRARLALVIASIAVALVLGEGLARLTGVAPEKGLQWWQLNPRGAESLLHRSADYSYRFSTDSRGLRRVPDGDGEFEKAGMPLRIVFIGDSFVFGIGVDDGETVPARLQRALSRRLARPVEVVNAGVPGVGPLQYWRVAHQYLRVLDPDLAIFGLLHYNDIVGNNPPVQRSAQDIRDTVKAWSKVAHGNIETPTAGSPRALPLWHSALFRFLYTAYLELVHDVDWRRYGIQWPGPGGNQVNTPMESCPPSVAELAICRAPEGTDFRSFQQRAFEMAHERGDVERACDCRINPWRMNAYVVGAGTMVEAALLAPESVTAVRSEARLSLAALERAIESAHRQGVPSLVSVFSAAFYVEPELFDPILYGGANTEALVETRAMNDFVRAQCEARGWRCFDPIDTLRAARGDDPLFIANDGHMTARGNQVYTDQLVDWVASEVARAGL